MAMTASSRTSQGVRSQDSERSPFARVTELLAPYQPAKPLITLSLGEPQHPVPGFVAPVLAKHIADFGRYPLAQRHRAVSPGGSELAFHPVQAAPRNRPRDRASGA